MRIAKGLIGLQFQYLRHPSFSAVTCLKSFSLSTDRVTMSLPSQPTNPLTQFGLCLQESISSHMSTVGADLAKEDDTKEEFFKNVRLFHTAQDDLSYSVRNGISADLANQITISETILQSLFAMVGNDACARESKLGFLLERSRSTLLLHRFFTEGKVATQASLQPCNDSEYIGALLTFAQSLKDYVLGRACEGDLASIKLCLEVVTELNTKMLEFDFRNGPLRRKYDGLKYALRTIEDIIFELSLQSPVITESDASTVEAECASPTKKMRLNDTDTATSATDMNTSDELVASTGFRYLDAADIDAIRERMDRYDQLREQVIKETRDVQKLSKQAIFAVIRGQHGEAKKKLDQGAQFARRIMETVQQHPTLRAGSFSNCLEEWAEGAITLEWVLHKRIMSREELQLVNSTEYIGALSDFTGEIGRLAVMFAGKRDFEAVREIYQADLVLANAVTRLSGNRFPKKLEMINTNLRKVGDIIYELSMLQRSGRTTRTKPVMEVPPSGDGGAAEKEE